MGEVGPGHVLGRYELLLPIASGGMAMVWAARLKGTRGFQKIVAVKTMLPKLSEDDQFEQMFLDEATLASQVHHPHIVEILDLGEQDGVLFLVMEWIDGVPLNQLMKASRASGGVPIPVAVRITMQACAGLHAAHELRGPDGKAVGLVHRDVSPQNIMVTYDGVAKVVDFGVAKATAMGSGATVAGQIKGKVAYMAPEQVKGADIDRRADIFAMGIVLYALTTGKHPFRRESEAATMYNICAPQPVMPPRKVVPDYPIELERIVLRALAKDVDKRYQSANELLKDLDQLPSHQRASTDDDVSAFVASLFGSKREERQAALAEALVRADEIARSLPSTSGTGGYPAVTSPNIQTPISAVTGIGGDLDLELPTGSTVSMLGLSTSRKKLILAGSIGAVVTILGIIIALSSRQPVVVDIPRPSAVPSVPAPTPKRDPAPEPVVATPPSASTSQPATGSGGATAASPAVGRVPVYGGRPTPTKPPTTGSGDKQSWKKKSGL